MTRVSRHYTNDKVDRQKAIEEIGEGKVIYTCVQFDEKRQQNFRYEITDTAILIVKAEVEEFIITKIIARPSRIKRYWADAPKEIVMLAVEHTRAGYIF